MITTRRTFLTGLIAAPVVIATPGLLMPVKIPNYELGHPRAFMFDGRVFLHLRHDDWHRLNWGSRWTYYEPDQWRALSTFERQSL